MAETTQSPHPLAAPTWVLLHVEGAVRGFKNALAFRRWCRKHAVPVRKDGHRVWVKRTDVDRAVEAIAAPAPDPAVDRDAVRDAVAAITGRRH